MRHVSPNKKFIRLMQGEQVTMKTLIKIVTAGMLLAAVNCTQKGTEPAPLVITKANCGGCHALPPADAGHSFHYGLWAYKCGSCHKGYAMDSLTDSFAVNTATHRNHDTDVVFSAPWDDSGKASFTKASKQCNNVYCHGGIPQGTHASIHWNGTDTIDPANCRACHDLDQTSSGIYAGHYGHTRWGKKDSTGAQIRGADVQYCFNCHGTSPTDSLYNAGKGTVDGMRHINGVSDPGNCKDCHAPDWTNWDQYLSTHQGATPFGKIMIN
jgi:predicted CxxxxCH...CXXCH cytochrome family protein